MCAACLGLKRLRASRVRGDGRQLVQRDARREARRGAARSGLGQLALEAHVHVGDGQLQVAQHRLQIRLEEALITLGVLLRAGTRRQLLLRGAKTE